MYMYEGPLENIQHLYLYGRVTYWGSFIWTYGGLEEDEECDYDHTLINDSNIQGGD